MNAIPPVPPLASGQPVAAVPFITPDPNSLLLVDQFRQSEARLLHEIASLKMEIGKLQRTQEEHRDVLYGNEKQGIVGLNARFKVLSDEIKALVESTHAAIVRLDKQVAVIEERVNRLVLLAGGNTTVLAPVLLGVLNLLGWVP